MYYVLLTYRQTDGLKTNRRNRR